MKNNRTENIDKMTIGNSVPEDRKEAVKVPELESEISKDTPETMEIPKTEEPRERPGVILKRTRENQGLSLEIVHEATKIPMDALRAIEEGYTIRMLSSFYYSGFVKMYATFLGIEVSEVIEDYKSEELPKHIDQEVEAIEMPKWVTGIFTRKRKKRVIFVVGVLLALFVFFKFIGFLKHKKPQPPVQKISNKIEPVKKEVKKVAVESLKEIKKQEVVNIAPRIVPTMITAPIPKPVTPVTNIAPVAPASPIARVMTVQKEVRLTVRANQNSWLRVKTDGVIVFQSTLKTGDVETWSADSEIEISGRNINQLEFELNGRMIGKLGRNDHNAKKVIITKSGLSVK